MRETNYRAHGEHRVKRKDRMNRINLENGLPTEDSFLSTFSMVGMFVEYQWRKTVKKV